MKWEGYCSPFISLYTPTNLTFLYLYIYCCDLFLVHFIIIHLLFFFSFLVIITEFIFFYFILLQWGCLLLGNKKIIVRIVSGEGWICTWCGGFSYF